MKLSAGDNIALITLAGESNENWWEICKKRISKEDCTTKTIIIYLVIQILGFMTKKLKICSLKKGLIKLMPK